MGSFANKGIGRKRNLLLLISIYHRMALQIVFVKQRFVAVDRLGLVLLKSPSPFISFGLVRKKQFI